MAVKAFVHLLVFSSCALFAVAAPAAGTDKTVTQQLNVSPHSAVETSVAVADTLANATIHGLTPLRPRAARGVCSFHAQLRQVCDKYNDRDFTFLTYMNIPAILDNNRVPMSTPFKDSKPFANWARVDLVKFADAGDVFGSHLMTQWQGAGIAASLKFEYGKCQWFAHEGKTPCSECSFGAWTKGITKCGRGNMNAFRTADMDCSFKCG